MDGVGPDQAVGWVIALACFFINFIMGGLARTAGVLYVALIEMHGVSREAASTPFSIRVSLRNMSGPFIGLIGLKYGIRNITIIGGFVAALGSALCYFAQNMFWITAFWGVIHGTGFGLSTVLHMMMINQYFDKYKASALGLAYSGDCFGTFTFPVIMDYLIGAYGIKGTFLILGGIVLNVVPMAMILKKPPWIKNSKRAQTSVKSITNTTEYDLKANNIEVQSVYNNQITQNKAMSVSNNDLTQGIDNKAFSISNSDTESGLNMAFSNSINDLVNSCDNNTTISNNEIDPQNILAPSKVFGCTNPSPRSSTHSLCRRIHDNTDSIRENVERHDSLPPLFEKEVLSPGNCEELKKENHANGFDHECKNDIECNRSLYLPMKKRTSSSVSQLAVDLVHRMRSASFASQVAQEGYIATLEDPTEEEIELEILSSDEKKLEEIEDQTNANRDNFVRSNTPEVNLPYKDMNQPQQVITRVMVKKETKPPGMFKLLLLTNIKLIFILISISMAVYAFLFVGVLTIIIDYAEDNNVTHEDGKYLIIGFSVTDLIGRLTFGQIIDRKLIKMKNYSGVTMLLMGTLVAVLPLNRSFKFMLVCMCMYGFVQGGTAIMFPILVSHYMEKREESIAMGCLNFYGGILMLLLAPMIGYFRDHTGSYDWVFHIMGCMVALVGIIWQFEPLIIRYQNKLKRRRLNYVVVTKF